jgi:hypothetical protein
MSHDGELQLRRIGTSPLAQLAPQLATLTALRRLDLRHNLFGVRGAALLRPHLARMTALEVGSPLYMSAHACGGDAC